MAVSKTDFINYSRCKRYVALDEVKKEIVRQNDYLEKNGVKVSNGTIVDATIISAPSSTTT